MILPHKQDRGIVVFLFLPSIPYEKRLTIAFMLIAAGILTQFVTGGFTLGAMAIGLGNLLLLVKGYDNRVETKAFIADVSWERVDMKKLSELKQLDSSIRRWDRSALDISNWLGAMVFVVVAGTLAASAFWQTGLLRILALDALLLLLPHWLTGIRRILRMPGLLVRTECLEAVLERGERRLKDHEVTLLMLLGGETKLPEDVKFKIDIADHHEDFLGYYGQVVINEVQGTSYPYFYTVLVARKGFGLKEVFDRYSAPLGVTKEFKYQREVEVLVIRRTTTKKSGYETKPAVAFKIFFEGLSQAETVAKGATA